MIPIIHIIPPMSFEHMVYVRNICIFLEFQEIRWTTPRCFTSRICEQFTRSCWPLTCSQVILPRELFHRQRNGIAQVKLKRCTKVNEAKNCIFLKEQWTKNYIYYWSTGNYRNKEMTSKLPTKDNNDNDVSQNSAHRTSWRMHSM